MLWWDWKWQRLLLGRERASIGLIMMVTLQILYWSSKVNMIFTINSRCQFLCFWKLFLSAPVTIWKFLLAFQYICRAPDIVSREVVNWWTMRPYWQFCGKIRFGIGWRINLRDAEHKVGGWGWGWWDLGMGCLSYVHDVNRILPCPLICLHCRVIFNLGISRV